MQKKPACPRPAQRDVATLAPAQLDPAQPDLAGANAGSAVRTDEPVTARRRRSAPCAATAATAAAATAAAASAMAAPAVVAGANRHGIRAAALVCALLAAAGCARGQAGAAGQAGAVDQATTRPTYATTAAASASPSMTSARPSHRAHALPLAGDVIVLDPGHNGGNATHPDIINRLVNVITEQKACDTTGTQTNAGYPEHAFTFDVAVRLARLLRKDGAKVVLTRYTDTGVGPCITQRAAIGNRAHASAAISIHADGGPAGGSGFEVIEPGLVPGYTNKILGPSRRLGLDIRNAYHAVTGEPYADYVGTQGLDVRTDLGGLNLSSVPKVFIECANMRNGADAARLTSASFRQRVAVALAAGFVAFLH